MITQTVDRNGTSSTRRLLRWWNSQVHMSTLPKTFPTSENGSLYWEWKPGMRGTQGKCQRLFPVVKIPLPAGFQDEYIDWGGSHSFHDLKTVLIASRNTFRTQPWNQFIVDIQYLILFLHRLYAGSSNTVAPNSSQGFQVRRAVVN